MRGLAEELMAKLGKPARKVDQIRNLWPEVEKLTARRFTLKQIAAELPAHGVDVSYGRFVAICRQLRKERGPAAPVVSAEPSRNVIEDARRRDAEKSRSTFQSVSVR